MAELPEYDEFVHEAFDYERPVYLYAWIILVVLAVLINIVVIWVLLQKRVRNMTSLIFVAIAIADSLTGLVTLPTYIMVYQINEGRDEGDPTSVDYTDYSFDREYFFYDSDYIPYEYSGEYVDDNESGEDAYLLSKPLCIAFMLSRYFFSSMFHTVTIWLTTFLGIQRYIAVAYPFKTKIWFTNRNNVIICIVITLAAPVLHLYHAIGDKTQGGFCSWNLGPGSEAYMWCTLFLRHLIPCFILIITTSLFIWHLHKSPFHDRESRGNDNRRISICVIAILVVFLILEIPYGIFMLYVAIVKHWNITKLDLRFNRIVHATYEVLLAVSFQLNFYIYTFLNVRFRQELIHTARKLVACCLSPLPSRISPCNTDVISLDTVNANDIAKGKDGTNSEMKLLNKSSNDELKEVDIIDTLPECERLAEHAC